MLNRTFIALLAALLFAGPALAADLPPTLTVTLPLADWQAVLTAMSVSDVVSAGATARVNAAIAASAKAAQEPEPAIGASPRK